MSIEQTLQAVIALIKCKVAHLFLLFHTGYINKSMRNLTGIDEIRQSIAGYGLDTRFRKEYLVAWLMGEAGEMFNCGLTLMPKKKFYKFIPATKKIKDGKVFRHLNKKETENVLLRFVHILNKLVLKHGYLRHNNRLPIVMTIEGEKDLRDFHGHFAIGKPKWMELKQFISLVNKAIKLSGEFEILDPTYDFNKNNLDKKYRYKLDLIDEGWLGYITKELDKKEFHNLYLP